MNKQEMELSQAFTELEFKIRALRMASTVSKGSGPQKHEYWNFYIAQVETSLADFKSKFYKIMLEVEEPE